MPTAPRSLLLVADVGNTRSKFGLFDRERCQAGPRQVPPELPPCLVSEAFPRDESPGWDLIREWLGRYPGASCAASIAGTNPAGVERILAHWPAGLTSTPVRVDDASRLPLQIRVEAPHKVGIDRLLTAVAANVLRTPGQPALIVDSGTATTIDLVSAEGSFEGGAILPGFNLAALALNHYTSLLPLISMQDLARLPHEPLGRNTHSAMRSGLFWGQLGAVRELVSRLGNGLDPLLILTGGGSPLLAPHFPEALHQPRLAMQGLAMVTDILSESV